MHVHVEIAHTAALCTAFVPGGRDTTIGSWLQPSRAGRQFRSTKAHHTETTFHSNVHALLQIHFQR